MKLLDHRKPIRYGPLLLSTLLAAVLLFSSNGAQGANSCSQVFTAEATFRSREEVIQRQSDLLEVYRSKMASYAIGSRSQVLYLSEIGGLVDVLVKEQQSLHLARMEPASRSSVDLSKVKSYSLSLENGRQALDVVRIAFFGPSDKSNWIFTHFHDYMQALERIPSLQLFVQIARPARAELNDLIDRQRADLRNRITVLSSKYKVDEWTQDGGKPVDLPRTVLYGEDPAFEDTFKGIEFSKKLKIAKTSSLRVEGGDIVVGDLHVVVGVTQLNSMIEHMQISGSDALKFLSHTFKKPVVLAGTRVLQKVDNRQYMDWESWHYHIDLSMVLAVDRKTDKEVALVHSPEAFLKLYAPEAKFSAVPTLSEVSRASLMVMDHLQQKSQAGFVLTRGEMDLAQFFSKFSVTDVHEDLIRSKLFMNSLRANGYEVKELPGFGQIYGNSAEGEVQRNTFFFGTNTVLSEDVALVPFNHLPKLDNEIKKIYNSLGYEVQQMKAAADSILYQGGTRCASETCRRPYLPIHSKPR